ncbi:MAG: hypothetical protein Kow0031_31240 [Anaerolineae bacterium]
MTSVQADRLSLHTPVYYQIMVGGILDQSWGAELNMLLTYPADLQDNPVTILSGKLADQSALLGLLMRLNGLGLPLISVESRVAVDG